MKRLLIATAVLASSLVLAGPAGAQTRSCPRLYGVPVMNVQVQGTNCWTASWLAIDEFNGSMSHSLSVGGGRWHVTWWYDNSQAVPVGHFRAAQGRAVVTWQQGT
jgi:hypothetical protein